MEISGQLREFVLKAIDSVEQLEVLCLLHAAPSISWTADTIDRRLRSDPRSILARLRSLGQAGLVASSTTGGEASFVYDPCDASRAELVDELVRVYAQHRLSVIELIYTKPPDPAKTFAEAFRLGRPDGEEDKHDG